MVENEKSRRKAACCGGVYGTSVEPTEGFFLAYIPPER